MTSPRWKKICRDLAVQRGRLLFLALTVLLSLTIIGLSVGAYGILSREMPANYAETKPADATIEIDGDVSASLLEKVRQLPGVREAEARQVIPARALVDGHWIRLTLFVIDDFTNVRLNTFELQSGSASPSAGAMLVERMALPILGIDVGGTITIKTPHGEPQSLRITGVVRDRGQAQAWQERSGYGYISRETLAMLGEPPELHELRVAFNEPPPRTKTSGHSHPAHFGMPETFQEGPSRDAAITRLVDRLQQDGVSVHAVHMPPKGRHPHQFQMTMILVAQLSFGVMTLVLSGFLFATAFDALMARQIREIGVMKAVGATSRQIAVMYGTAVTFIAGIATTIAVPLGLLAARAFSRMIAGQLNFVLHEETVPHPFVLALCGLGVALPVAFAGIPILRATRSSVRQAMDDWGAKPNRGTRIFAWSGGCLRLWVLALKNCLRSRSRFILSAVLLAVGGAIFLMAANIRRSWDENLAQVLAGRRFDLELRLSDPQPDEVGSLLEKITGVQKVESWGLAPATPARADGIMWDHMYPDRGHGATNVMAPPPAKSALFEPPLLEGRWLGDNEQGEIVLTPQGRTSFPQVRIGDTIALTIEATTHRLKVVGFVEEFGLVPLGYVNPELLRKNRDGRFASVLRVASDFSDRDGKMLLQQKIEEALARNHIGVEMTISSRLLQTVLGAHLGIMTAALKILALLTAGVGAAALSSTISISTLQRTREFGVIKAIGATPAIIRRLILSEGMMVALVSWVLAVVLAVPLTFIFGGFLGTVAFGKPFSVLFSSEPVILWLAVTLVSAGFSSLPSANRAARLSVREALTAL